MIGRFETRYQSLGEAIGSDDVDVDVDADVDELRVVRNVVAEIGSASYGRGIGAIPVRGAKPKNGQRYTTEDDALNIAMRATETYTPARWNPKPNDPGRCKGWSKVRERPCRKWSVRNADGEFTSFCADHFGYGERERDGFRGVSVRAHTAGPILAGASAGTKHGAYSALIRERLVAIMELRQGTEYESVRGLLLAMDSVDTDNPSDSLDFMIRTTMGMVARLLEEFAAGKVKFGDLMVGMTLMNESVRKLTATKHDVVGTADDENERAIREALDGLGLGSPTMQTALPAFVGDADDGDEADSFYGGSDDNE